MEVEDDAGIPDGVHVIGGAAPDAVEVGAGRDRCQREVAAAIVMRYEAVVADGEDVATRRRPQLVEPVGDGLAQRPGATAVVGAADEALTGTALIDRRAEEIEEIDGVADGEAVRVRGADGAHASGEED